MPQRYIDWFRQAEADYKAAKDLFNTGNYSWCCFACQQCAEKALKALLDYFRQSTRGHNLVEMIKLLKQFIEIPHEVERSCYILNRYYLSTRYPNMFVSGAPVDMFSKDDAEEALKYAETILKFVKNVLFK